MFYWQLDWAMDEPVVSDMSITDEHIVVASKTKVSEICAELSKNPDHAILVKKGSDILGVVTARDIFRQMAEGLNATKVKVDKIMRTNVLSVIGNTPLSKALEIMSGTPTDAVIVVDEDNEFLGYFSVNDYRDATRRLEAHLLMASRLSRSRKAIAQVRIEKEEEEEGDLLDLLLGNDIGDEEEIPEIPSMIMLD